MNVEIYRTLIVLSTKYLTINLQLTELPLGCRRVQTRDQKEQKFENMTTTPL
jgi:hypothetical protein